jgi:mitogen-activated protein kinase kinase
MATPIRKKRNFKALQLKSATGPSVKATPDPPPVLQTQSAATRNPPQVLSTKPTTGKKRPPPMTLKAPKISTTSNDHDGSLLTVSNGHPSSAPPTASASKTYHSALSEKLANFGEDLKNEDLKDIQELGQGNGGSVKKVEHTPTGTVMAKKVCGFRLPTSPPLPFLPPPCLFWFAINVKLINRVLPSSPPIIAHRSY